MSWNSNKLTRYNSQEDVRIHQTQTRYQGFMALDAIQLQFRRFEGDWSPIMERELLRRQAAAGVLIWDPKRDELLFIEQFRIGAMEDERTPWCLEVVAGIADAADESFETLLRREAQEEANVTLEKLEKLPSYFVSPGGTNERMHLYLGYADLTHAGGVHGLASENEDIRTHCIPAKLLPELLEQGVFNNAASLIAVQWFLLNSHAEGQGRGIA